MGGAIQPGADFGSYDVRALRNHVISRAALTDCGTEPFRHLYISEIFPQPFYRDLLAFMLVNKAQVQVPDRHQDSKAFVTTRFKLVEAEHPLIYCIRAVFDDAEVKLALLQRFYIDPTLGFAQSLAIHKEFEFFFCKAGRFQDIHVDIPPKCLSFVFYMPMCEVPEDDARLNATVLYDKQLVPRHPAMYQPNTCCIFAAHFYSYHGFASTIDRDVMVMFLISADEFAEWRALKGAGKEQPPFTQMLDAIENKIRRFPLIEYEGSEERIRAERAACLINAPSGRVMRNNEPPADEAM